MILIVDSGSSKTDWIVLGEKNQLTFSTVGLNPNFHDSNSIANIVKENTELCALNLDIQTIYFYGAGCSSPQLNNIVSKGLEEIFQSAEIHIEHDLMASAKATYTGVSAISCILGTGSNACFFDGQKLIQNTPSLGYILGDEASGAYFGKKFLAAFFYNQMPINLKKLVVKELNLTKENVINNLYKEPHANTYLAAFMPFLFKYSENKFIKKLIQKGFREFLTIHVCCYPNYKSHPVHFVGSIAYLFKNELETACSKFNITCGQIIKNPIDNLVEYHKGILC